jgi:hypothetical protein
MKIKRLLAVGGVAAVLIFGGASVASAAPEFDCVDFGHQVDTSAGDPYNLDRDKDGIGCEDQAAPPVKVPVPSPTSTPTPTKTPELAKTGAWGPSTHPIRWSIAASGAIAVGAIVVVGTAAYRAREN